MKSACERYQLERMGSRALTDAAHASACADCGSFVAVEHYLAPPDDLVVRTLERLRPILLERAARRRGIVWRLTLAGAFSLPFIVALNTGLIWMSYLAIERVANPELAWAGASMITASLLLALSLAYGSLPLIASWGLALRERTS